MIRERDRAEQIALSKPPVPPPELPPPPIHTNDIYSKFCYYRQEDGVKFLEYFEKLKEHGYPFTIRHYNMVIKQKLHDHHGVYGLIKEMTKLGIYPNKQIF